jgi:hypothetical protein
MKPLTSEQWRDRELKRERNRLAWMESPYNRHSQGIERVTIAPPPAPPDALTLLRSIFRDESIPIIDRVRSAAKALEYEGVDSESHLFLLGVAACSEVTPRVRTEAAASCAEFEQRKKSRPGTEPRASILEGFGEKLDARKRLSTPS